MLPVGEEKIPLRESLGRVSSRPVFATISSPPLKVSAMDGFALSYSQTISATEVNPVCVENYALVNTGFPIPEGFDAVLPKEEAFFESDKLKVLRSLKPGENVRYPGESFLRGELLLESCRKVGFQEVQLLAASGISELWVWKKPKILFIPVGDELAKVGENLEGKLAYESNSFLVESLVHSWGGDPEIQDILPDDYNVLLEAVEEGVQRSDVLIVGAGSSKGEKDYTRKVISKLGKIIVEGISCKPGKPLILGEISGKPVVGLPGYPVSAWVGLEFFVRPLISAFLKIDPPEPERLNAVLSRGLASSQGTEEIIRVRLGKVSGRWIAVSLPRGAGNISSLGKADGYISIPQGVIELERGAKVEVCLFRKKSELEKTLLFVGSHDLLLDILADELKRRSPCFRFVSIHVGSLGGLFALKNREAHLSGMHLFDEETGEYNIPFIKRHLPGEEVEVIDFVYREQGLILPKGNPKGIRGIADLARKDIRFVNRQRGSGTRVLLDYLLKREGISPSSINGYEDEELTHLGVAMRVASGNADVGMGIYAAARIMDLDFIPLFEEKYDLITLREHLDLPQMRAFLDILDDPSFKERALSLGGYRWGGEN